MAETKACIVSDSSILVSVIRESVAPYFERVASTSCLDDVAAAEPDDETVYIVEAIRPSAIAEALDGAGTDQLGRVVLLLRGNQDVAPLRSLVGLVGAILPSDCTADEIALTARIVRQGLVLLPSDILASVMASGPEAPERPDDLNRLTEREQTVLDLIAQGASNKTIARRLDISDSTTRVHVRSILKKLGMQNRTQAALFAARTRPAAAVAPS
ncbi:response regulator transcription factor [Chthonobacter rhizosphaerae]|uniref:response regulator transcription factor n=1 Tax=Chthonobacter rhizosphaerae TaxID=2735553 RepID=UPI001AED523E|nr:response regulator transcription factor [Chthonobacter rhizosphaerae]